MTGRLDIVVFGATGFTRKIALRSVYKFTQLYGRNLSWGIAGRSVVKMKAILRETSKKIGADVNYVPIIIADADNEPSIQRMAKVARVIINCCGPYQLHGEVVVKACIENGTHVVDVAGEIQYIDNMKLKYHRAAEESGCYVVNACGVNSIVSDLGVIYLENNFKGNLNSVEVFLTCTDSNVWLTGSTITYSLYESAAYVMGNWLEMFAIKEKLNLAALPYLEPKLAYRLPFPINNPFEKWGVPFLGPDRDIMEYSQRYFYENDNKRPIQTNVYWGFRSLAIIFILIILGSIFIALTQFRIGRYIVLQFASFFSAGYVSNENPSEKKLARTFSTYNFYGEGWDEGFCDYRYPPNKCITGRISVKSPVYGLTALSVTLCAVMILTEADVMPKKGGIYTPAAAFSKTSLLQQLRNNGVKFKIMSIEDLEFE